VDFGERIQINGIAIPRDRVTHYTEEIRTVAEKLSAGETPEPEGALPPQPGDSDSRMATITFFEFITAVAFLYFRAEKVDVAVIEAGMGGRLDATNVLDPLLSLITNISMEHAQYLGGTIKQIAREKAGIIKPGRPLLTTAQQPAVLFLFRQRCRELGAPLYAWGKDFKARKLRSQVISFQGRLHHWPKLYLALSGSHQIFNASLALAAAEGLQEAGWAIGESHVRRGLAEARWPGRLEMVSQRPRILLDGAHNPGATRVLRKALLEGFPRRRLIMILGIMADKEVERMMADLVPLADRVILTRPKMERAASLATLHRYASPYKKPIAGVEDIGQALSQAAAAAQDDDLILVSGSLFTVGEARAFLSHQGGTLSAGQASNAGDGKKEAD
jgi:dihydrofolate synthase / folylpolyglutamate synthase